MNYRHGYHSGNFADVIKHVIVARIVEYLKRKDKAFRVIDTHAGCGLYDLGSAEAQKTGEWKAGIGRLTEAKLTAETAHLLEPYLSVVRKLNPDGGLTFYPGSPFVIRSLLRKQDRLTAVELHPQDVEALKSLFAGDHQVRVMHLDGWLLPGSQLPPKEKRGLVLVDPPFEKPGDFDRLIDALEKGHKRWTGGIYALWYPLKHMNEADRFTQRLKDTGIPRILDVRMFVDGREGPEPRFRGTGMALVNAPHVLAGELSELLPELTRILAPEGRGSFELTAIAGERDLDRGSD